MKLSTTARAVTLTLTLSIVLAACGSGDSKDASDAPDTSADTTTSDDMAGMDMTAMNMGDPDAAPADEVEGAALARGEYQLLDTRPAYYDDVEGTVVIARSPHGTTVTTELTGLIPNVDYIAHVHAQPCADDNAGAHYQFEIGGSTTPPNEIHLAFTSDDDGNGHMTVENHAIAGLDAVAFVLHPQDLIDNKVACADFIEDEPGAVLAAVEAGVS